MTREAPFLAIFGGSFNPPHLAHVLAVTVVLARFDVARVLVIPTYQHPFAKALAPFEDRLAMCQHALGWLPKVEVSRVEEELGGESRTLRTLEHLRERYPTTPMRLVMGADIVVESAKWFGFDRISVLAPPLVLGRAGVAYEGAPPAILPEISSTDIRAMIAAGRDAELEAFVPRDVLAYVRERRLYTAS